MRRIIRFVRPTSPQVLRRISQLHETVEEIDEELEVMEDPEFWQALEDLAKGKGKVYTRAEFRKKFHL